MKSRITIAAISIALGFGIYLLFSNIEISKKFLPEEFSEARIKGAALAKNIVDLSSESLRSLTEIAEYDEEGNSSEALILISKEVIKNRATRDEAIKLSSQLEKMARSLTDIEPTHARILATEAVSSEVALVSRLISYNDYLLQLFETLEKKFLKPAVNSDGRVVELIKKINEESSAINQFNYRFNESLAEFDKVFVE